MMTNGTGWLRTSVTGLILAVLMAVPAQAAERNETLRFDASALDVENLAGQVQLRAADGDEFVVEATVVAGDAELLGLISFETETVGTKRRLRVAYPTDDYRVFIYRPGNGHSSRSQVKYMGRKVTVTSSTRRKGAELHVDLVVYVPTESSLKLENHVGKVSGEGVSADLRLDTSSGSITIENSRGDLNADTGSGSIRVVEHRGAVVADTGSGSVHMDNVLGDVEADTGSGSVMLRAVTGNVVADTGSGHVELEDILADRVAVDTGSGGVSAQRIRGAFEADTGSGSVRVRDFEAGERIKIDTGSGRIELTGDMSAVRDLDLDTGSGGVSIEASQLPSMRLRVNAGSGAIEVQVPDMDKVRSGDGYLEATLGDGAGRGRIETGSGGVRIRKL